MKARKGINKVKLALILTLLISNKPLTFEELKAKSYLVYRALGGKMKL